MPDHPPRLSGAASSARGGSLAKSGGRVGRGHGVQQSFTPQREFLTSKNVPEMKT